MTVVEAFVFDGLGAVLKPTLSAKLCSEFQLLDFPEAAVGREGASMSESPRMDPLGEAEKNYLRAKLQEFLSRNPEAEVRAGEHDPLVSQPWGEVAIEIPLRSDDEELFEALNAVRLPPRFTAIWHEDSRDFEVIFTVLRSDDRILERQFDFRYRGSCYRCGFGPSSPRLRAIARKARPSGSVSRSNFRNLQPLYRFEHYLEEHPDADYIKNGKPTSFWIRGIGCYDDDRIGDLVRNLNFHMSYFDRDSPTIVIHEELVSPHNVGDQDRSDINCFPDSLSGHDIDQHLLVLWASAQEGDLFLRFIQYYQILEYAGFYHVKEEVRREVERAIAAPDAGSRPDKVAQQLLDAIAADRRPDEAKINAVIEECVDAREMWDVLGGSLSAFAEDVKLDGGFVLPALVSASTNYDDFIQSWNRQFPAALHRVRNALVHARESRQSTTIAPTTANFARLSPWLLPLSQTAARVMLYCRL